jgi:uncharacterized lipoprotein
MQKENIMTLTLSKITVLASLSLLALSGCSIMNSKNTKVELPKDRQERREESTGKLLGAESLVFGGGSSSSSRAQSGTGMTVNPHLWRAALETLSFMPIASADANGGVLVTDWYTGESKTSERIKVTVEITSTELRVKSLKVLVHKQHLKGGTWVNQQDQNRETAAELETIILGKARQLRMVG